NLITSFFFQAEDGIRDGHVTGVQTCALPISRDAQQGVVVVWPAHSSSSPTRRLVWSTSATILSYGIRVGPSTPMTPDRAPIRYEAVTSVKGESRESWCSPPIVIVRP